MNRLQAARIYLCGPIENHQNDFAQWRTIITKSLNNSIDNIVIWDPIIKPSWLINEDREALDLAFNKQLIYHNYYKIDKPPIGDRIWNINSRARQICQGLAGSCDILIARLTKTFSWGSVDELEVAIRRHIPVFIWFADEPVGIYGLPGIADNPEQMNEYIFYNMDDLLTKLGNINNGIDTLPEKDPARWLFLSYPNATKTQ